MRDYTTLCYNEGYKSLNETMSRGQLYDVKNEVRLY